MKNNSDQKNKREHSWDGIEEYNNPLPRWWLWTFYITIFWSLVYIVIYPSIPFINLASQGLIGYDTRKSLEQEIDKHNKINSEIIDSIKNNSLYYILNDNTLTQFANSGGAALFRTFCSQCHGAGAAGSKGYPNLLDDDWLWGGDVESIYQTILHGIRSDKDDETRYSEMPQFKDILEENQIQTLTEYVLFLSQKDSNQLNFSLEGQQLFQENCIGCHGENGLGNSEFGAPNLTDKIWLYGGNKKSIQNTINYSHFGMMPAWDGRLDDVQIKQLAIYVFLLGGGNYSKAQQ